MTADPYRHGVAYVVWDRVALPQSQSNPNSDRSFAFRGTPMFSMTSDGGTTWSTPRSIMPTNANLFTIGNQIVVLPDSSHTLVDVFQLSQGSGIQPSNQNWEAVLISKDGGATWVGPFKISKLDVIGVTNPDDATRVRAGAGIPDISVDPSTSGTTRSCFRNRPMAAPAGPIRLLSIRPPLARRLVTTKPSPASSTSGPPPGRSE